MFCTITLNLTFRSTEYVQNAGKKTRLYLLSYALSLMSSAKTLLTSERLYVIFMHVWFGFILKVLRDDSSVTKYITRVYIQGLLM